MFRGIFDIIRGFDPKIEHALALHDSMFILIDMFIWNLIPMGFQLMTLIFGYIRNKKIKKHKLEIKKK